MSVFSDHSFLEHYSMAGEGGGLARPIGFSGRLLRSITPLHGDPVAKSQGTGVTAGPHLEVHLLGLLAGHGLEGTKHATGADGGIHGFVDDLQGGSISEFHKSFYGILGLGIRRIGGEEEFIALEGAIHQEVGVPVRFSQQLASAH